MSSLRKTKKPRAYNEFLNNTSIHGLRLLLFYTPLKHARSLWKLLIIAVIFWTHFIIINLIIQYIDQPTEVHMSTNRVHISNSPFPAFGVCEGNKFSRRKLQAYAERVFSIQQRFKHNFLATTPKEMFNYLLHLDDFYLFPNDENKANETILAKLDILLKVVHKTSDYPIQDILTELGPDCENLIIRGIVYGIPVNISDYFRRRLTTNGVCCMFNYKRESYAYNEEIRNGDNRFIREKQPIQFEANSILNSIQFVLQSNREDFTVRDFDIEAFEITVFPQYDYPNIQSSHIGHILVDYYSIVEIPIQPEFYDSSDSIRQFKPTVRNCYFPDEGQKVLNRSYYSIDECLLQCRSESMTKHCGCVSPPMGAMKNLTYCNFNALPCLREWNAKWYDWNYFAHVRDENNESEGDSTTRHKCRHCLPTCDGVNFRIHLNEMTMRRAYGGKYSHGLLKDLSDSKPLAIVKLFFKQRFAQATEMDIIGDWVVLLNRFGGIMGLMYGFSIISLLEILYYATGKFLSFYWNNWKLNIQKKAIETSAVIKNRKFTREEPPPAYDLYWNELIPKRRTTILMGKLFDN
ncbi:pickpocket 18 [Musca autumnalis]|uniref:pickpocket 18 n=1 Tax=Musca autumnalis TaxID=221902 RepID=UPI003CEA6F28